MKTNDFIMLAIIISSITFGFLSLYFQNKNWKKRETWIRSLKMGDKVLYRSSPPSVEEVVSFNEGLYFNSKRFLEDNPDKELRDKNTVLLKGFHRYVPIGDIKPVKK
jgi:hypothetical protein